MVMVMLYLGFKGFLQRGEFIENTAEGPDVGLLVVRFSLAQLWRYVAWGAHNLQAIQTWQPYSFSSTDYFNTLIRSLFKDRATELFKVRAHFHQIRGGIAPKMVKKNWWKELKPYWNGTQ
jgi:hypothetical protein